MYCDKDKYGRYTIMELTAEEIDTIKLAVASFRGGLFQKTIEKHDTRAWGQYKCCLVLAELIAQIQTTK